MATYAGKDGAVYSGTNAVAEIKDWSLETTSATTEDTVMGGDGWTKIKPTLKSWTSSFSAVWNDSDSTGQATLVEGATIALKLYPTGNSSGYKEWAGSSIVTTVNKTASVDGLVEASFTVTGSGPLAENTVS